MTIDRVRAVAVYGPGLGFRMLLLLLMFGCPLFAWLSATPLGHPALMSLWTCALITAVLLSVFGTVRFRLDEQGITRVHFWKRKRFAWEDMRAIREVEPEGQNRAHYWEVLGRRARVLFKVGTLLGRREQFFAEIEKHLRVHRQARIRKAHEERGSS